MSKRERKLREIGSRGKFRGMEDEVERGTLRRLNDILAEDSDQIEFHILQNL